MSKSDDRLVDMGERVVRPFVCAMDSPLERKKGIEDYLVRVVHGQTNTSAIKVVHHPLFYLASVLGREAYLKATRTVRYEISGFVLLRS